MKALVVLLLLESLDLAWCCSLLPWAANIASRGQASQSTVYYYTYTAEKAIDGSKNLNLNKGFCACTNDDMEPWWRLDMGKRHKIEMVVVSGRSDCCLQRMKDLEVRIGDSPDNNNPVCGKISDTSTPTTTFCCDGMEGQYVSMVIPGRREFLTLCEVEVYGTPKKHRGCG